LQSERKVLSRKATVKRHSRLLGSKTLSFFRN
jgi:hypothetical protein